MQLMNLNLTPQPLRFRARADEPRTLAQLAVVVTAVDCSSCGAPARGGPCEPDGTCHLARFYRCHDDGLISDAEFSAARAAAQTVRRDAVAPLP